MEYMSDCLFENIYIYVFKFRYYFDCVFFVIGCFINSGMKILSRLSVGVGRVVFFLRI